MSDSNYDNAVSMTEPPLFNISKYGETFFQTHFLLFLSVMEGSGSFRRRIDSLEVKTNELTVNYSYLYTSPYTNDVACWQIILELPISWKDFGVNTHNSIDNPHLQLHPLYINKTNS